MSVARLMLAAQKAVRRDARALRAGDFAEEAREVLEAAGLVLFMTDRDEPADRVGVLVRTYRLASTDGAGWDSLTYSSGEPDDVYARALVLRELLAAPVVFDPSECVPFDALSCVHEHTEEAASSDVGSSDGHVRCPDPPACPAPHATGTSLVAPTAAPAGEVLPSSPASPAGSAYAPKLLAPVADYGNPVQWTDPRELAARNCCVCWFAIVRGEWFRARNDGGGYSHVYCVEDTPVGCWSLKSVWRSDVKVEYCALCSGACSLGDEVRYRVTDDRVAHDRCVWDRGLAGPMQPAGTAPVGTTTASAPATYVSMTDGVVAAVAAGSATLKDEAAGQVEDEKPRGKARHRWSGLEACSRCGCVRASAEAKAECPGRKAEATSTATAGGDW